jgi:uncharacterized DUF497 family protein
MVFEWDSAKSDKNARERGIGFEVAVHALNHVIETAVDRRRDYGEIRVIAKCRYEKDILVIVYTLRGQTCRIISVRKANSREKEAL